MIDDPRKLAARLIAASPLAMSIEDALKQKRERRAALLAAPTIPERPIEPEPLLPVVDAVADYARDFWRDKEPAPKPRRQTPRKKPSDSPPQPRGPFRVIEGGKNGDKQS